MMEDSLIYSKLFDIVENNMEKNNMEMEFTKEAFLFQAEKTGNKVDMAKMLHFNNKAFFEASYLGLLDRFPDEQAVKNWNDRVNNLPKEEFQRILTTSIINSLEFRLKNIEVYNCIYGMKKYETGVSKQHVSSNVKMKFYDIGYKYYKRLPIKIKMVIRKLAGRD